MSRPSNVFESLYSRGSSSQSPNGVAETTAVDDEAVAKTVREAVHEALAEHERTYHDADEDTNRDAADETDDPSASGRSPVGLLGGAAVLALLGYLARKRRRDTGDSHHDDSHARDATDDESTDAADR